MKKKATSTTKMAKKQYFVFTDSRLNDVFIENFGDRVFYSRRARGGNYATWNNILINGNLDWEINEKHLTNIAADIFGKILEIRQKEEAEQLASRTKKDVRFGVLGRCFQAVFGKTHDCQ